MRVLVYSCTRDSRCRHGELLPKIAFLELYLPDMARGSECFRPSGYSWHASDIVLNVVLRVVVRFECKFADTGFCIGHTGIIIVQLAADQEFGWLLWPWRLRVIWLAWMAWASRGNG